MFGLQKENRATRESARATRLQRVLLQGSKLAPQIAGLCLHSSCSGSGTPVFSYRIIKTHCNMQLKEEQLWALEQQGSGVCGLAQASPSRPDWRSRTTVRQELVQCTE